MLSIITILICMLDQQVVSLYSKFCLSFIVNWLSNIKIFLPPIKSLEFLQIHIRLISLLVICILGYYMHLYLAINGTTISNHWLGSRYSTENWVLGNIWIMKMRLFQCFFGFFYKTLLNNISCNLKFSYFKSEKNISSKKAFNALDNVRHL